jgi:aspartate aminotransferase-like enzyme
MEARIAEELSRIATSLEIDANEFRAYRTRAEIAGIEQFKASQKAWKGHALRIENITSAHHRNVESTLGKIEEAIARWAEKPSPDPV